MSIRLSLVRGAPLGARAALAMSLVLSQGCISDSVTSFEERSTRLAMTAFAGSRPMLVLASLDGREAVTAQFTNVVDEVPGNDANLVVRDAALLNLAAPRWSPSGKKVAVVATLAYDQSVVVIYDAPSGAARVASPNTQIVSGGVDWSPAGDAIAYTMSTQPLAGAIDLFVTDLASRQVKRLTTGAGLAFAALRVDHAGTGVYYSKRTGEHEGAPSNVTSLVAHVDITSRTVDTIRAGIVGEVQAIARTGAWALVLRNRAVDGLRYRRDLLRVDLSTGAEVPLITNEVLESVQLGADDSRGLVAVDAGASGASSIVFDVLDLAANRRDRIPGAGGAIHVDVSPRSFTGP